MDKNMQTKFEELQTRLREIQDLSKASAVLSWDRQTHMPRQGADARARQLSTLAKLVHERQTDPAIGDLLEALDEWSQSLDPDNTAAALVRHTKREFSRARMVPTQLVQKMSEATGISSVVWQEARAENNFAKFLPHIEKQFELAREYAACFPHFEQPFDALLDQYEQGLTTSEVSRIFDEIKVPQSELVKSIAANGIEIDDSIVRQRFPHNVQLAAALEAAEVLGYDQTRGRLDLSTHPFATSFSVNDARITTRVDENFLNTCLYGTLHETGHALYELGVSPELEGLPLARGTSSGIHESQSRLFENLVGRSRAFAEHLLPLLQKHFPGQLGQTDVGTFYQAINKVEPSFIRVEADEVSYNLHIILRFELEREIFGGKLAPKDLPEAWNTIFEEYLGITPPDDKNGVLQDVHWSWGYIGHFQSYALGNIISALWWHEMGKTLPEMETLLSNGNIAPIRAWLGENVHYHGRKLAPSELIERVTGNPIDTAPYLDYLQSKFGELYQL
jgi:carboxypeptidase Taq